MRRAPLKVAVIGCGNITRGSHLPAILANPDLSLVSVVDTSADRRNEVASLVPGCRASDDVERGLDGVDVTLIATPPSTHVALARAACRKGVHVLCEKPLAVKSADGRALSAEFDVAGLVLALNHQHRQYPAVRLLRQLVESGLFGGADAVWLRFGSRLRTVGASGFLAESSLPGAGVLMDVGTHLLDLCRHLFADFQLVSCAHNGVGGPETHVQIEARGTLNGRSIPVYVETSHVADLPKTLTVRLGGAALQFDYDQPGRVFLMRPGAPVLKLSDSTLDQWHALFPFAATWAQFVAAVRGEPASVALGLDGAATVEMAEWCRQYGEPLVDDPWVWNRIPRCELS